METNQPNECECCPVTSAILAAMKQELVKVHGMWMCPSCANKEAQLQAENKKNEQARVDANNQILNANSLIAKSKEIDQSIQLSTDIFNANTVAIQDLKTAIDSDDSITNKQFALAEAVLGRIKHYGQVIFDARATLVEAGNAQRAHQTYLNTLANQLRAEEREKLKLQDINYNPIPPKSIKPKSDKPRAARAKKFDKDAVRNFSAQYNVPMEAVQMLVTSKNMTPEDAAKHMAKMLHGSN